MTSDAPNNQMDKNQGQEAIHKMLDHAWRYFALHAGQRMSVFNFFLVLAASVAAVLAASLQREGGFHVLGMALGCILVLVSFIFWKLDQRTAFLVKHAEAAIAELEVKLPIASARLASTEPAKTDAAKKGFVLTRLWTYRIAFTWVFTIMGFFGFVGGIWSWCKYMGFLK
jgi:hypothetical protein